MWNSIKNKIKSWLFPPIKCQTCEEGITNNYDAFRVKFIAIDEFGKETLCTMKVCGECAQNFELIHKLKTNPDSMKDPYDTTIREDKKSV